MAGLQCNRCGGSHGGLLREHEELEECYQHYRKKHIEDMQRLRGTISGLKANLVTTEAWLVKYGEHKSDCTYHTMRFAAFKERPLCDCGWDDIVKELNG